MTERFERLICALVDLLVRHVHTGADVGERAEARRYVLSTVRLMPQHLRLGLRILAWLLDGTSLLRHGRLFTRLPCDKQQRQLERWRTARLAPKRSMIAFFEMLSTHGLYCAHYARPAAVPGRLAA